MDQDKQSRSRSDRRNNGRRTRYIEDSMHDSGETCIICGLKHVHSGRIFHGQCVCEECVEYMINLTGEPDKSAAGL